MELLAYGVAAVALSLAALVAFTGEGSVKERAIRCAIPAPLYVGAPVCGLALRFGSDLDLVVGLANIAIVLAVGALIALMVLVGALVYPFKRAAG